MNTDPFHQLIPEWMKTPLLFILLISQSIISGLQGVDINSIASQLGEEKDLLQFASYTNSVGLVAMIALSGHMTKIYQRKNVWLICLALEFVMSLLMSAPNNVYEVIFLSFSCGTVKIICLLDAIRLLMQRLNPSGSRGLFYGIYYTISFVTAQLVAFAASWLIVDYEWYYIYYLWIPGIVVSIFIVQTCLHRNHEESPIKLKDIDWFSYLSVVIMGFSLSYICVMGEKSDWWYDKNIILSSFILFFSTLGFIINSIFHKHPMIDLSAFIRYKQIGWGIVFMVLLYIVYNSSSVVSAFLLLNFKGDVKYANVSNLYMIPAFFVSVPLTGIWLHKRHKARGALVFGFLLYTLFYFVIKNLVAFNIPEWTLIIPQLLRGAAYGVTMTSLSYYVSSNVELKDNTSRVFFSVFSRYVVAMPVTSAFFSHRLSYLKTKFSTDFSQYITPTDPKVIEYVNVIKSGFISKGLDMMSAENMALASLQKKLLADSILRGVDEIFMMLCIISVLLMLACLCLKVFNIHYEVWKNTYPLTKLS
ncbi:MFS transporter [Chryseobacterium viscerum]|uniref:MFS transporter n=1 Tax=Chryseobacterium viscerum TaxID=1037377 RepID=UPI002223448B|nr:MFS transporter [Chryseobacterium viscerum]MCW1964328.1 MFS transporter [Chryseobacterium viscerum]